ncbi:MAG: ATP-binding protein [Bacteroidales bacterium]|nr:ATP-binding protein [Bacteroidales bacterium]
MKELLKTVIADQLELVWQESYVPRVFPQMLVDCDDIVVISGIRRCGKSTLLQQLRNGLDENDYYLNFDDDRLIRFTHEHFALLHELFIELFGVQKTFYFDEIQNIKGWEVFVRRLHDYGNKIFITGSNARMLSRELGTHLTGRFIQHELYPFSFREFLSFEKLHFSPIEMGSTSNRATVNRKFGEYLLSGGFPLFLRNRNDEYLKSLYHSVLYRDVLVRNGLTNEKEMLELVYYLASNISKLSSNSGLTSIIGVKNPTTIKNYIGFLQDSYLFFQISKYDVSLKKQLVNPKKTYMVDNALVTRLGFSFSSESGRLLENLIFIELRRRNMDVYYHHNRVECDFVIRDGKAIVEAIQVCFNLNEPGVREREIAGLMNAMSSYDLSSGTIITLDEEGREEVEGKAIKIVKASKWLV